MVYLPLFAYIWLIYIHVNVLPMDPMGVCFCQEFLRPILPAHPLVPSNGGALGRPQHASGVGWVQRRRFGDSRVGSG